MATPRYVVTVKEIDETERQISFQADSHDDIIHLAEKIGADNARTLRLLVGAKLLGVVLREQRDNPQFKEFLPQFITFMQTIKKSLVRNEEKENTPC